MALYTNFFHHGLIRKYVVAFGHLFNSIEVVRYNADGSENSRVQVPIAYGAKEKYVVRLTQDPNPTDKQPAIVLPRMGYEIAGVNYAPDRKQPNNLKIQYRDPTDPNKHLQTFNPVPYDIQFNLYAIVKSPDEGSQIAEQIMPIFTPDYTIAVKTIPEINKIDDISISLVSTVPEDTYDGSFQDRRYVIWSFQFNMKAWFYGPVPGVGIIKNATTNLWVDRDTFSFASVAGVSNQLDRTPLRFASQTISNVQEDTLVTFELFTLGGMSRNAPPVPISIVNGEYSLDGGITWTSDPGTITQATEVMVRHTSAPTDATANITTLTISSFSADFTSTTVGFNDLQVYEDDVYEPDVYVGN